MNSSSISLQIVQTTGSSSSSSSSMALSRPEAAAAAAAAAAGASEVFKRELLRLSGEVPNPTAYIYSHSSELEEEEEEFEVVEKPTGSGEEISEYERLAEGFLHKTMLGSGDVMTFGNFLQKNTSCIFVYRFLLPISDSSEIEENFHSVKQQADSDQKPIFIPIILESSWKQTPLIGSFFRDHIVLLTYADGKWEYYDSQGVKLENETRKILGLGKTPQELLRIFDAKATAESNVSREQTDRTNCGVFVCNHMYEKMTSTSGSMNPRNIRAKLYYFLQPEKLDAEVDGFEPLPEPPPHLEDVECATEITVRLNRILNRGVSTTSKTPSQLLEDNAQPYLKKTSLDRASIFAQINKDLPRSGEGMIQFILKGAQYDGTSGKDAQAIFDELQKTGRDEQEILKVMTLFQQGVFASSQTAIMQKLKILGMDSVMNISGDGQYLREHYKPIRSYKIRTTADGNIQLTCTIFYELKANDEAKDFYRKLPYGIIEATVQLDLASDTASESWSVREIIE